jgi:hypothetical protein
MIRRLLNRFRSTPDFGPEMAAALAATLSGVSGPSSFAWCGHCGRLLTPIVVGNEGQAEIAALACVPCRGTVPVCVGVLMAAPPAEAPAHG